MTEYIFIIEIYIVAAAILSASHIRLLMKKGEKREAIHLTIVSSIIWGALFVIFLVMNKLS